MPVDVQFFSSAVMCRITGFARHHALTLHSLVPTTNSLLNAINIILNINGAVWVALQGDKIKSAQDSNA